MNEKWVKIFIIAIITWFYIVLLGTILAIILSSNTTRYKVIYVPIEVNDTLCKPKFFSQSPEEGIEEALSYYNLAHKDIVYAQAILETGHFTSKACKENNNLFGLYDSEKKEYYKFNHWTESVIAYKKWIQKRYIPPNNYYTFLEDINYAEDKQYTELLKKIVKNKKDDKRKNTERNTCT